MSPLIIYTYSQFYKASSEPGWLQPATTVYLLSIALQMDEKGGERRGSESERTHFYSRYVMSSHSSQHRTRYNPHSEWNHHRPQPQPPSSPLRPVQQSCRTVPKQGGASEGGCPIWPNIGIQGLNHFTSTKMSNTSHKLSRRRAF